MEIQSKSSPVRYRNYILTGVTASIAGITQSLVLDGHNIVLEHIKSLCSQNNLPLIEKMALSFVEVMKINYKNDRVIVPLFKLIAQLLSRNCFDFLGPSK